MTQTQNLGPTANPKARALGRLELKARRLQSEGPKARAETETEEIDRPEIGDYRLLRKLASGGMAEVYLACARDDQEQRFALKVLRPNLADKPQFQRMLANEAKLATAIRHENVCRVYSQGQDEDRIYLVMEYIEGMSFSNILRCMQGNKSRLHLKHALALFAQACDGAAEAHRQASGIIHRDIAPDNLLVSRDGVVKLCDFGISKADWVDSQTRAGTIKGKWRYMSPEQAMGMALDIRTDVFSLGIVLYELITCRSLFRRPSSVSTHQAVVSGEIPSVQKFREVPDAIAAVVAKALQRDRDQRYASAAELGDAIREAAKELGPLPGASQLAALVRQIEALPSAKAPRFARATKPEKVSAKRTLDTTPCPVSMVFPKVEEGADTSTRVTSAEELKALQNSSKLLEGFESPTVVATNHLMAPHLAECRTPPAPELPEISITWKEQATPAPPAHVDEEAAELDLRGEASGEQNELSLAQRSQSDNLPESKRSAHSLALACSLLLIASLSLAWMLFQQMS